MAGDQLGRVSRRLQDLIQLSVLLTGPSSSALAHQTFGAGTAGKSFTAYNKLSWTAKIRFMEFTIRPGSCNDCSLWSGSWIGTNVRNVIPFNHHFFG
ncbi:hypothetical protein JG687_00019400 [Phytophthora cactorum]|uniref:Uncharacterized protein n=1 Tax=Phytophthora cactorum TaxID=29920 RepID=A0A8T1TLZ0_9STRA|nr:hypothetical protein JG687_00019400 [Phytophthora cactorum]